MSNPNGRPKYYTDPMVLKRLMMPAELWNRTAAKAADLSEKAGRKITTSDLIRNAIERLLKEI